LLPKLAVFELEMFLLSQKICKDTRDWIQNAAFTSFMKRDIPSYIPIQTLLNFLIINCKKK